MLLYPCSLQTHRHPIQRSKGNLRYLDTINISGGEQSLARLSGKTIQALASYCRGDLLGLETMIEPGLAIMLLFVN